MVSSASLTLGYHKKETKPRPPTQARGCLLARNVTAVNLGLDPVRGDQSTVAGCRTCQWHAISIAKWGGKHLLLKHMLK